MSIRTIKVAFELIEQNEAHADFLGPMPEHLLNCAEHVLGQRFPPSYRAFLRKFGCGGFNGREFYGVTEGDYVDSVEPIVVVPDAVWSTLRARREYHFPASHLIIGVTGDGGIYAIDLTKISGESEHPVVEWWADGGQTVVARNFGEFFLQSIRAALINKT